jgi:hypothetical protein
MKYLGFILLVVLVGCSGGNSVPQVPLKPEQLEGSYIGKVTYQGASNNIEVKITEGAETGTIKSDTTAFPLNISCELEDNNVFTCQHLNQRFIKLTGKHTGSQWSGSFTEQVAGQSATGSFLLQK